MNDSRSILLPCLLPITLCIAFHAWVYSIGSGDLVGPDSFLRLLRVAELSDSWAWYDQTVVRMNAPHGMSLHWTRPFDLLLLAGAGAFAPIMGFDQALHLSGMWISPLLHLFMLVALYWATAPILDVRARTLAVVAALAQVGVIVYAVPGRADHHMLILLLFVGSLGLTLRLLLRPHDAKLAFVGGVVLGFGLWVSTEFVIMLVPTLGALAISWILHGGDCARRNRWHALGVGVVILLAILAERPPGTYLTEEYDRVSVVHLLFASLVFCLWTGITAIERRGRDFATVAVRLAAVGIGAVAAAALLLFIYPKFFGGPGVDVDPRLGPPFHDKVTEMQPLLPTDGQAFAQFLVFLGPALVAAPFLIFLLRAERRSAIRDAWLYLALMTALFLPLALAMVRFAPYAGLLAAIPLAELLGRMMKLLPRYLSLASLRFVARVGLVGLFVLGFTVVGSAMNLADPRPPRPACKPGELTVQLNDPDGFGAGSRIILAHLDWGSELVYRTRHAVVSAPYHRNIAGILDTDLVLSSPDESISRRLIEQRGVDLVLICADQNAAENQFGKDSFVGGLLRGRVPSWLRRMDTPGHVSGGFLLFEVLR